MQRNPSKRMDRVRVRQAPKIPKGVPRSETTSKSKSAIWVMAVGPTITLPRRSRLASIAPQRSSSERTTILLPISGPLLARFLKWWQEIFSLSLVKVRITTRMTITWLKWWSSSVECQRTWQCLASTPRSTSIVREIWDVSKIFASGLWRKCSQTSIW